MEPYRHHVFVCTQNKPEGVTSCPSSGSMNILGALYGELGKQGLSDDVQVTSCGCLGLCDEGPVMIVYPEGVWYRKLAPAYVQEIVASHLHGGTVVTRVQWNDPPAMKVMAADHTAKYLAIVKAKDDAGILPDDLNEMTRSFMPARVLLTALELDIFTAVSEGASAAAVATKIGTEPRATEMLLNALASLKLLEKHDGAFTNLPASARFLAEGSKDNARPGLLHTANLWHRWSSLTDAVRKGGAISRHVGYDNWVNSFIAAMELSAKERAGMIVKAIASPNIKRVLDLGGGSGAYSIALARAVPDLKADILDTPEVVPLTRAYIDNAGLAGRIAVREGNMLTDPLGEGYDLMLVLAICHMFSADENRMLFERAFHALAPGGQLVVQDFIMEPDKTAPRAGALFALNMLVGTAAGSTYSELEYAAWLREAGFTDVRRVRFPGQPSGLMIAKRP
jgi:(2Fe-2S) ferredoxin/predicted O-methyltransferase YrrM